LMVPEIERLVPAVNGAIQGAVRLAGPLNALDATAHINAPLLTIGDVQLADVVFDIARDDAGARNRMTATAARVDYGPLEIRAVALGARGDDTRAQVDLSWRLFSEPASRLRADVARNDDRVGVQLHADALLNTPYGAWRLNAPASIDIGEARLVVSDHCWERAGDVGSVCVERLRRSAGITDLAGTIVALPLQWLHVFVEDLPRFAGELEATWQVRHDAATGTANGQLQWHTQGLGLTEFAVADGDDNGGVTLDGVLDLPELVGGVNFHGTGIEATLFAAHNGNRVIDAHLNVSDLPNTRRLDGRATLQLTDLSFVPSLVRDLGSFEGTLVGVLAVSGTAAAPELRGNLALEQGSLAWLNPFIELDEVSVRADLDQPDVITLTGTATSDRRGELTVQGRIENPLLPERVATIQIRGRDVLVQIPDSRVYASPDLTLTWRDQQAMLVGTLEVPRGQLVAPELPPTVVARSTDVVVLDREVIVDPALRYSANVRLVIGDDVHLMGFGLTARFGGDMRLVRTVDGLVEVHGSVLIREGQFGAYGQTLQIDSGGLTFAGPPTNPYVNARAVRRIERPGGDIVVGILITGELENMESTLISEPPMSEGNALSYLMLGRPLRDSTPGEGDELVGAALALGLSQAAPLIEEIGRTLGLDELTAIGDDTDDLTVIAGKQLTARLFVRYSYHAFLGASAMMLRYELTDRLSLETTASETPGFDIMYRVTE
jgi:translocation and assembly module TamB